MVQIVRSELGFLYHKATGRISSERSMPNITNFQNPVQNSPLHDFQLPIRVSKRSVKVKALIITFKHSSIFNAVFLTRWF